MALLELNNITKSFGGAPALKGVSFELQPGEIHALLGENGAGKSTLIKIITGAHRPDSGEIFVAGQPVHHLTPAAAHRLGIACVYQQPALFPDLTVAENIALRLETPGLLFTRIRWSERRAKARELLRRIGAEIPEDLEIRDLSMPEQQLVEIACAIGAGARIVIMDEPTASLTQKEQRLLFAVARELRQAGAGVIYISHRLEEIFALADRVTVLRDGQSVSCNPIAELNESELIQRMVGREISHLYPDSDAPAGEIILSVRNLQSAEGVRNVSFDLRAGEILGVAGLVGAGRTELARALFGITPAGSGEILLRGQPICVDSPRTAISHGIAYLPEDRRRHGVILEMPIAENITMASHREMFPRGWIRFASENTAAHTFIRDLGIKASGPAAPVASLSGGNQQKVSLARWLAASPKILILDEPTQGVDVGAKSEIHKLIRQLAARGLAVLMISSDLPEIIGMSDRILVMRHGSIAAELPGKSAARDIMTSALGARA